MAVFEALYVDKSGREDPAKLLPMPDRRVGVRFANYEPVTPMKYLKSQCIGKFVSVKGTVIRVSTIKKCGFETLQRMTDGKFDAPAQCESVSQCKDRVGHGALQVSLCGSSLSALHAN
jgi:DNA replicative helicase MCM subunit Mcm2 (Cdc46/Mcm family)